MTDQEKRDKFERKAVYLGITILSVDAQSGLVLGLPTGEEVAVASVGEALVLFKGYELGYNQGYLDWNG